MAPTVFTLRPTRVRTLGRCRSDVPCRERARSTADGTPLTYAFCWINFAFCELFQWAEREILQIALHPAEGFDCDQQLVCNRAWSIDWKLSSLSTTAWRCSLLNCKQPPRALGDVYR